MRFGIMARTKIGWSDHDQREELTSMASYEDEDEVGIEGHGQGRRTELLPSSGVVDAAQRR